MISQSDFDREISRLGTYSAKWKIADQQGKLPLSVADMDIPSCPAVIEALAEWNQKGIYGYTELSDDWQLQVRLWLLQQYQWDVAEEHIVFCPRIIQAIALYMQHFTQPDDSVVTLTPSYHPIHQVVEANHLQLLESELIYDQGYYSINFEDLERKFTKAKIFILLSPHNPTGRVWLESELIKIAELAEKHHVFIISDDVHADFIFSPHPYRVISTVSDYVAQHSFICTSPAKTFNLPGLEIANIVIANNALRQKFQQCLIAAGIHNPGYFSVPALLAAYQHGKPWLEALKQYLNSNRKYIISEIDNHFSGIKVTQSQGSYLLWFDYRGLNITETQLKQWILNNANIELGWGSNYGTAGIGFFRINIAAPKQRLVQAIQRMKETWKIL